MPIPKPSEGEKRSDFMGRCVSFLTGEGRGRDQAVAICSSQWKESESPWQTLIRNLNKFADALSRIKKDRILLPMEKRFERELGKIFRKQGRLFVKRFEIFKNRFVESVADDSDRLFDMVFIETEGMFHDPVSKIHTKGFESGAAEAIFGVGADIAFDLKNPRAVEWFTENGARLITQVNETTRFQIKRIVRKAIDEGWSYDRAARNITKRFSEFATGKPQLHIDSRAHLVAVTESAMAYEAGAMEAGRQMQAVGIVLEKKWSTTGDSRVSDGCLANEDQGWIDLDEPFESGHDAPPRFPGCRCAVLQRRKTK